MLQGIGKPVRRKEDLRFITGRGRYTADIELPGQLYLAVSRSPFAHARIKAIDTRAAAAADGVVAVITADDLTAAGYKTIRCVWPINNKDGTPMPEPDRHVLAKDKAVHVGDPVAAVIAESKNLAKDAVELLEIDYEPLPTAIGATAALEPGAPLVWDDVPGNLACDWELGDKEATEAAFKRAPHVVRMSGVQNRLVPSFIEPRAANAQYDSAREEYTLYATTQNPHVERHMDCRFTMEIPQHKLRVISPDVGGGFGGKMQQYPEHFLCMFGAKLTNRPVKWVAERSEGFISDSHARDHDTRAEMAFDEAGKILAIRSFHAADLGAYVSFFAPTIPTVLYATMLSSVYTVAAIYSEVKLAFTNTPPVDAYRGAGRPEVSYAVERLIELAAEVVGIDSIEFRRRNFVPTDAFPYENAAGMVYDQTDYFGCLDLAMDAIDYSGFGGRRAAAEALGRVRGIGLCVYTEHTGIGPSPVAAELRSEIGFYESTTVRVNPDATVTVLSGAHTHGQGHETSFAQIVAEKLHVSIDDVDIVHGDTGKIPHGIGTFASRSMVTGGGALSIGIDKVIKKGKLIAAHVLESPPDDIEFIDGFFKVGDSDRIMSFKDIAHLAYLPGNYPIDVLEPGLEETSWFDPPDWTYAAGCHICEVEIDPETGHAQIVQYSIGDDFGVVINPMIVDAQIHGGVTQGIGQALMENAVFDGDSGQMLAGSFLDYCMPRADNLPMFEVRAIDNTTDRNPLGVKGCGEAGATGAPVAVMNAIFNALKPMGVTELTMPATPDKIWAAIHDAGAR